MKALGIIPARGGSTGLPGKNLRKVAGEPLIAYACRVADTSSLDVTIVISDDAEILNYARGTPGVVSLSLVEDLANGSVVDASRFALLQARAWEQQYDAVVLLQPDSPIRLPTDIDACLKMLDDNPGADGVISVYKVEDAHPAHMYEMDANERIWVNWSSSSGDEVAPRQVLPPIYHRNGAIYVVRQETLMKVGWIPHKKLGYVMPRELSLTIDTEFDLMMAERQVQLWKEGKLTKPESSGLTLSPSRQNPSPAWMG